MKKFAFQIISLATVWRGFLWAGWEAAAGSRREMRGLGLESREKWMERYLVGKLIG